MVYATYYIPDTGLLTFSVRSLSLRLIRIADKLSPFSDHSAFCFGG
jgi:hypothetical protein